MKIAIPISISKTQYYINFAYINFVKKAGLEPILVTYDNDPESVVEMCDGLLIPGGVDVDPIHYGETNLASFTTDIKKDSFERELFWMFAINEKPIFGICRGFQMIMREFLNYPGNYDIIGFDRLEFMQHVPGHSLVKDREVPRDQPTHWVVANEILYGTDGGSESIPVNSIHHQALLCSFPANSLNIYSAAETVLCNNMFKILAVADFHVPAKFNGYIIEAAEITGWVCDNNRMRGVQWHPEELVVNNESEVDLLKNFFLNNEEALGAN